MENMKNAFEKIVTKYTAKKELFKKIIDRWKEKEKKQFQQASSLFQDLERLEQEINQDFVSAKQGTMDDTSLKLRITSKNSLRAKIREFKTVYNQLNELLKPVWRQWIEAIVVAGVLVFVLRTFIFGLYHVPTGSAEKTILVGDRIWGNKMSYYLGNVKHGDCVIFDNPEFTYDKGNFINYYWQKYVGFPIPLLGLGSGPDNWVKRVIAIPGDTIEGQIEDGKTVIYRNGKKLDETEYINPYPLIGLTKSTGLIDLADFGPLPIPSFLRKIKKNVYYTYDPSKSFEEQPYYNMKKEEVIRKFDGEPTLRKPHSPTYTYSPIPGEYGRSIDSFGPIRIPEGKYWVMGDSRKNSQDSRYWGFLDQNLIHGRASFVIYSIDSEEPFWLFELINHPINFWIKSIRWNRFFKNIK